MNEIQITISLQDAQTLCQGAMSSEGLSAAQATQTVARVQQAIQEAVKQAAEVDGGEKKPKSNVTPGEPIPCKNT